MNLGDFLGGVLSFLFFFGPLPVWQGAWFLGLMMTVTNKFIPVGKGWKGLAIFLAISQLYFIGLVIACGVLLAFFSLLALPVILGFWLISLLRKWRTVFEKFKKIGINRYQAYGICWGIGILQLFIGGIALTFFKILLSGGFR